MEVIDNVEGVRVSLLTYICLSSDKEMYLSVYSTLP